ncbi:MAG TPA: DNA recombination protein RmuC [Pseudolabrys sp.]|nr:DNA recombination protein RmuC [Pseudolabrys sp.]
MSEALLLAFAIVIFAGILAILVVLLRSRRAAPDPAAEQKIAELDVRVQTMGDLLAKAQSQLQQTVHERLDAVSARIGESMQNSTKHTAEHLQQLHARLAVIDSAQKNITELSSQVGTLQQVLSNKQSRGAFGQAQMEAIVRDHLPKESYEFQATLSNRARPDCCIYFPGAGPCLVIDAKFPLEAVTAFQQAKSEDEKKLAMARIRQDISRHITDIADKYLIPGETQDIALMFVPSESIYCELYDGFDDLFQKAYRAKVSIVSPSLLMLAIQVIQQIRKDAKMREAADKILAEVGYLVSDVQRLRDRVENLEKHFGQANSDLRQIVISADKIVSRGDRIQTVEFGGEMKTAEVIPAPITRKLEARD